jgi:hypothetical protein
MISKNLTRRLEHLESLSSSVGEPTVHIIQFVDTDLKVVKEMQFTLEAPASNGAGKGRRWRRRGFR